VAESGRDDDGLAAGQAVVEMVAVKAPDHAAEEVALSCGGPIAGLPSTVDPAKGVHGKLARR
jgi:hypothetical protein